MLKIFQQQISERWDTLPMSLREALYSPEYGKTIWKIGVEYHLDDRKIGIIVGIAGYVILGFLQPEDVAKEIREGLNLNPEIANSIAREIDRKIFSPIKSDLEKVYSPVAELPEIKPKPKPEPTLPVQPEPEPQPSPEATAGAAKPASFPTAQPEVPAEPLKTILTTPVPAEKPFILFKETEAKPVTEKKKITFPAIDWFKKKKPPKTEAPVKVELEIFGPKIEEKKEPTIAKTEAPKQKVIHYRETEGATPFGKPEEPKVINLDSFEIIKEKEDETKK